MCLPPSNRVHFAASRTHFTFQKTHLAENLLLFFLIWCIIYSQNQGVHRRSSDTVKIKLETVSDVGETEVVIRCRELDEETERLLSTIRLFANTIIGKKDNKTFILKPEDICYFDTQDNKVMLITEDATYETPLKMYEIEEKFKNTGFLRVSRYSIINLRKVSYLEPLFNGRMVAVMKNGDKVVITRLYIQALKNTLGM
ncbi:MAG: LytTR family transcriptional regulator [Ruminococcaceae bacterium]|nr:LytTR family transcriptional regulator [Oscillospiraceae bacterium]